ncbi:MAG: DUF3347 domain-containing protein [Bacteroidota bacterium]
MKRLLIVLLIAVLVIVGLRLFVYKSNRNIDTGPVQQPLTVSKHTDVFNLSAQAMITAYYSLTEGFVLWDTSAVTKHANELKTALDSLRLSELQKDTIIYETASGVLSNARTELDGLIKDQTLEEKRLAFNSLTQYIYDLLRTVRYDQSKIYFQECPMAFNDSQPGNWLSKTSEVRNPYLGTQHPKYKSGMLSCGGPKDTLNFMVSAPTK